MRWFYIVLVCSALVSGSSSDEFPNAEGSDRNDLVGQESSANETVTEERTVSSEQRKDGIHHKVTITKKIRVPFTVHVEKRIPKIIEVPVDKPFNVYVPKPYPVIVEKKVPYEIKVPQLQPYTVEKKVPYPVKVLVDKPYTLHVPKPYPVEVDKKYEFTVEKKVPVEVKVPVERPYPVHVIVEKEVKFPVETKVPVPVKVPYDKPIPIHVHKHVPVHVDKPVSFTVEKVATYPVRVPFRIPIKMHYPEGESFEGYSFQSNQLHAPDMHNLEWSEAMATATRAIKGFEQSQRPSYVRQGYSSGHQRGVMQRQPYHLPSAKVPYYQQHSRRPTKLHPLQAQRHAPYEVTEHSLEPAKQIPFSGSPESHIMVPQLVLANAPSSPGSTHQNLVWQGELAVIPTRNVSKPHHPSSGEQRFVSQAIHHGPVQTHANNNHPTWQNVANQQSTYVQSSAGLTRLQQPHKNEHKVESFQKYDFEKEQTVRTQEPHKQNHKYYEYQKYQLPSATYYQGTPQIPTSTPAQDQPLPSRPSFTYSYQLPGPPAQPKYQLSPTSTSPKETSSDHISSSFVGSKTFHDGQELTFTTNIQHEQANEKGDRKT